MLVLGHGAGTLSAAIAVLSHGTLGVVGVDVDDVVLQASVRLVTPLLPRACADAVTVVCDDAVAYVTRAASAAAAVRQSDCAAPVTSSPSHSTVSPSPVSLPSPSLLSLPLSLPPPLLLLSSPLSSSLSRPASEAHKAPSTTATCAPDLSAPAVVAVVVDLLSQGEHPPAAATPEFFHAVRTLLVAGGVCGPRVCAVNIADTAGSYLAVTASMAAVFDRVDTLREERDAVSMSLVLVGYVEP